MHIYAHFNAHNDLVKIYIIQLTKDYTTGNATFKQGSRGTVIEVPSRREPQPIVTQDNGCYESTPGEFKTTKLWKTYGLFTSLFIECVILDSDLLMLIEY